VIDGHEDVLIELERLLEDEGFDTVTTWSARDGLAILDKVRFDLVLVNEYLPDLDAEDFLQKLVQRRIPDPCMVMQPSAPQITETRKFHNGGAVDVVCKRAHQDLLAAVRKFLASRSARQASA
jgi:DNA-binding response OmpR family regulator